MFNRIGQTIMSIAVVAFIVGVIASIVGAVGLWMANSRYASTILPGFGVLIGGCIASWLSSLFLYGFGELIEQTTCNRELTEELLSVMRRSASPDESGRSFTDAADSRSRAASIGTYSIPGTNRGSSDYWTCRNCGSRNHRTSPTCSDCGSYK